MNRNSTRPLLIVGLLGSSALISGADGRGGCGHSHDEGSTMAPSGASGTAGSPTAAGTAAANGAGRGPSAGVVDTGPAGARAAAGRASSGANSQASAGRRSSAGASAGAAAGAGNGSVADADGGAACIAAEGEHCGGNIANPCSCASGLDCVTSAGAPAPGDVGGTCKPGAPAGGSCSRDADCTLKADYCTGCDCVSLAPGQKLRPCSGPGVQCFVDPCGMKTAACQNGTCVAR
jgi:hypothetical protein